MDQFYWPLTPYHLQKIILLAIFTRLPVNSESLLLLVTSQKDQVALKLPFLK